MREATQRRFVAVRRRSRALLRYVAIAGVAVYAVRILDSFRLPDLRAWHTVSLDSEFGAEDAAAVASLDDYRKLEDRLFAELRRRVEVDLPATEGGRFNRFVPASASHPDRFGYNWNRTSERVPRNIRGGALLLHGLTDSPYSLRSLAEQLEAAGYYVLLLRIPGHGTHPGALLDVVHDDWRAAARLGARHVRSRVGDSAPFLIVGYSMGGALTIDYALDALEEPSLPQPDRLILFSPAVGVSATGAVGGWHRAVSFLPWFQKFRWLDVLPEYDPFKYNSFSKNAGRQMYLLTRRIAGRIVAALATGRLDGFPPTLTFQSLADGTVSTRAVLDGLYTPLGDPRHALVLFDVNHSAEMDGFMDPKAHAIARAVSDQEMEPFRLTLVTNAAPGSREVVARELGARPGGPSEIRLGVGWPQGVYSLSHIALTFPPDDVLYGVDPPAAPSPYKGIRIGAAAPRGERRLLTVSMNMIMRLRHNPFHAYLEKRVGEWLRRETPPGGR